MPDTVRSRGIDSSTLCPRLLSEQRGILKILFFLQPINEVPGYLRVRSRGRYHIRTSETKKEISLRSENNFLFYRHFKSTRPILKVCEKSQKSVAIQIFDPIAFLLTNQF